MTSASQQRLRLAPRLVPEPLWGISAARLLRGAVWRRIRADALQEATGACVVCRDAREKGMVGDEVLGLREWRRDADQRSHHLSYCNAVTTSAPPGPEATATWPASTSSRSRHHPEETARVIQAPSQSGELDRASPGPLP